MASSPFTSGYLAQADNPRLFSFSGGTQGPWRVLSQRSVVGPALTDVQRVDIAAGVATEGFAWCLQGVTSHERYVGRAEKDQLVRQQEGLGRPGSTLAALIPLRKSAAWWALTQDERRDLFEAKGQHTAIGLRYLPAIARKLHHCRDLSHVESFDFLTWFEYAPAHATAFDDLLAALRATPEWRYVDWEVDIRLVRDAAE